MYSGRKISKSQSDYKSVYVAHNPHTVPLSERKWPDQIRIFCCDPGVSHFSLRIETRSIKSVGPITTLLFDKVGLKKEEQELTKDLVCNIYSFISNYLDQHLDLIKTCHMVIIEKQLPINYRAVRVSQHVLTYLMEHLKNLTPNLPMFFEVIPQLKGRELGAPPTLNEKGIKAWAVEKAFQLLTDRNDQKGLEVLNRKDPRTKRKEKKDDLSDTVVMIEALFSNFGWPLTQKVVNLTIPKIISTNNNGNNNNTDKDNDKGKIKLIVSPSFNTTNVPGNPNISKLKLNIVS